MKSFFVSLSRQKKTVVAELFLVYFALGVGLIMLGSVLPHLRAAYHLDYQTGGALLSIQSVGYLAIGLVTGLAATKLGPVSYTHLDVYKRQRVDHASVVVLDQRDSFLCRSIRQTQKHNIGCV